MKRPPIPQSLKKQLARIQKVTQELPQELHNLPRFALKRERIARQILEFNAQAEKYGLQYNPLTRNVEEIPKKEE